MVQGRPRGARPRQTSAKKGSPPKKGVPRFSVPGAKRVDALCGLLRRGVGNPNIILERIRNLSVQRADLAIQKATIHSPLQWNCAKCTFLNHPDLTACEICGGGRAASGAEGLTNTRNLKETKAAIASLKRRIVSGVPLPAPHPLQAGKVDLRVLEQRVRDRGRAISKMGNVSRDKSLDQPQSKRTRVEQRSSAQGSKKRKAVRRSSKIRARKRKSSTERSRPRSKSVPHIPPRSRSVGRDEEASERSGTPSPGKSLTPRAAGRKKQAQKRRELQVLNHIDHLLSNARAGDVRWRLPLEEGGSNARRPLCGLQESRVQGSGARRSSMPAGNAYPPAQIPKVPDKAKRDQFMRNDPVRVFSISQQRWFEAKICRTFCNSNGESLLRVRYKVDKQRISKTVGRYERSVMPDPSYHYYHPPPDKRKSEPVLSGALKKLQQRSKSLSRHRASAPVGNLGRHPSISDKDNSSTNSKKRRKEPLNLSYPNKRPSLGAIKPLTHSNLHTHDRRAWDIGSFVECRDGKGEWHPGEIVAKKNDSHRTEWLEVVRMDDKSRKMYKRYDRRNLRPEAALVEAWLQDEMGRQPSLKARRSNLPDSNLRIFAGDPVYRKGKRALVLQVFDRGGLNGNRRRSALVRMGANGAETETILSGLKPLPPSAKFERGRRVLLHKTCNESKDNHLARVTAPYNPTTGLIFVGLDTCKNGATTSVRPENVVEFRNRRAFVIGHSDYKHASKMFRRQLKGVLRDVARISRALNESGFFVTKVVDIDKQKCLRSFHRWLSKIQPDDDVLIYYAGHGLAWNGRNWILPPNIVIETPVELPKKAIDLNELILDLCKTRANIKICIIDACSNHVFDLCTNLEPSKLQQSEQDIMDDKARLHDMARINASEMGLNLYTLVTASGTRSNETKRGGGRLTTSLITQMQKPGLRLQDLGIEIRRDLLKDRNADGTIQMVEDSHHLIEDFTFRSTENL